jgi:hypothetical protein
LGDLLEPHRGKSNLVLEHYHPDLWGKGKTNPLSVGMDTNILGLNEIQAITAYNSLGQYSTIEKLPHFTGQRLRDFDDLFINSIKQHCCTTDELVARELLVNWRRSNFRISSKTRIQQNILWNPKFR